MLCVCRAYGLGSLVHGLHGGDASLDGVGRAHEDPLASDSFEEPRVFKGPEDACVGIGERRPDASRTVLGKDLCERMDGARVHRRHRGKVKDEESQPVGVVLGAFDPSGHSGIAAADCAAAGAGAGPAGVGREGG